MYTYSGESVSGDNLGVVFDLGLINVADYKTIKVLYQALSGIDGNATNICLDNVNLGVTKWGGPQTVDLKALAETNNITSFSQLKISHRSTATGGTAKIVVAYIILEVAD